MGVTIFINFWPGWGGFPWASWILYRYIGTFKKQVQLFWFEDIFRHSIAALVGDTIKKTRREMKHSNILTVICNVVQMVNYCIKHIVMKSKL